MDKSSMSISRNNINSEKINIHLLNYIDSNVIIFSLIGFLLSRTILIGSIAPLGIAFFLGISKVERYRIPIFISTIIGVISSGNSIPYILKYIICLFIFMIIKSKKSDQTRKSCKHCQKPLRSDIFLTDNDKGYRRDKNNSNNDSY